MRLRGWVRPIEKRDRLSEVKRLGERLREQREYYDESEDKQIKALHVYNKKTFDNSNVFYISTYN